MNPADHMTKLNPPKSVVKDHENQEKNPEDEGPREKRHGEGVPPRAATDVVGELKNNQPKLIST